MKYIALIILIIFVSDLRAQYSSGDTSHCHNLIVIADSLHDASSYQSAYDAYKTYIESCAYLSNSYNTFTDVGAMNSHRSDDLHRFEEYREWLKKVLYYNSDTNYYCADVGEILTTFSWFNDQRGRDIRGNLAVLYFLVNSNRCPAETKYLDTTVIPGTWAALHNTWQDTVSNPNLTPFDSTLPTIEDLGLSILRGNPAEVKQFLDAVAGPMISNIISLPNPFTDETRIDFTCREAVAVKFEVFDLLGKRVYNGGESVYSKGENEIKLNGEGLPHGLLYGRFSASDGTVRTVKLVKTSEP
jgi:hypothetical protein